MAFFRRNTAFTQQFHPFTEPAAQNRGFFRFVPDSTPKFLLAFNGINRICHGLSGTRYDCIAFIIGIRELAKNISGVNRCTSNSRIHGLTIHLRHPYNSSWGARTFSFKGSGIKTRLKMDSDGK